MVHRAIVSVDGGASGDRFTILPASGPDDNPVGDEIPYPLRLRERRCLDRFGIRGVAEQIDASVLVGVFADGRRQLVAIAQNAQLAYRRRGSENPYDEHRLAALPIYRDLLECVWRDKRLQMALNGRTNPATGPSPANFKVSRWIFDA